MATYHANQRFGGAGVEEKGKVGFQLQIGGVIHG